MQAWQPQSQSSSDFERESPELPRDGREDRSIWDAGEWRDKDSVQGLLFSNVTLTGSMWNEILLRVNMPLLQHKLAHRLGA